MTNRAMVTRMLSMRIMEGDLKLGFGFRQIWKTDLICVTEI